MRARCGNPRFMSDGCPKLCPGRCCDLGLSPRLACFPPAKEEEEGRFPPLSSSTPPALGIRRSGRPLDDPILPLPQLTPGQMQWIFVVLLLVVNSMEMLTQARRKKRVSTTLFENCTGCIMCTEDNGCTSCQQRLFLLIWRDGIRQYGACVHACPSGYFGVRGQEVNRCIRCRSPSCDSCFSKDFCMKCKEQFYLHKGKCFSTCPPNTTAQHNTRECQEKCEMNPWGNWSPCSNEGRTCGSKWGSTTRVREVLRSSKEDLAAVCLIVSESRKCRLKKHCPGERNENRKKEKKEKKQRKKKKLEALMVT